MKACLTFGSLEEFVVFVLASSSVHINSEFMRMSEKKVSCEIDFLSNVDTIHVPGFVYSCESFVSGEYAASPQVASVDFHVINYMLNQQQIENESILITFADENDPVVGIENVREYLIQNLATDFLLRVGWRTDYMDFIFHVNTLSN